MLLSEECTVEVSQAEAREAARLFAGILAATPQYEGFDLARRQLQQDATAQQAIRDFQQKQQHLQMMQMWGAISESDQHELHRLHERMMEISSVQRYVNCQEELARMCREVAQVISEAIGTDFVPQRSGCCG
ncbi:MAG: YlbF family regulator [Anaerolineae bacterium]